MCNCKCASSCCIKKQMKLHDEIRDLKLKNKDVIDKTIKTLESVISIAEKITSGNASHIKGNITLLLDSLKNKLRKSV